MLTVNPGPATWAITSGSGTLSPSSGSNTNVTFTAGDTAGGVTITATGAGCNCSITLTVVEPANWTMRRQAGTNLRHNHGRPDCGWLGNMDVHPDDVNFYRVEVRELDSHAVTTGSYSVFSGVPHGNYPPPDNASAWLPATTHNSTSGTRIGMVDNIYSGDPGAGATGTAPPFTVGTMFFPITFQWRVVGGATNHNFPVVRQEHSIAAPGRCESSKGGNIENSLYSDPTSTP